MFAHPRPPCGGERPPAAALRAKFDAYSNISDSYKLHTKPYNQIFPSFLTYSTCFLTNFNIKAYIGTITYRDCYKFAISRPAEPAFSPRTGGVGVVFGKDNAKCRGSSYNYNWLEHSSFYLGFKAVQKSTERETVRVGQRVIVCVVCGQAGVSKFHFDTILRAFLKSELTQEYGVTKICVYCFMLYAFLPVELAFTTVVLFLPFTRAGCPTREKGGCPVK